MGKNKYVHDELPPDPRPPFDHWSDFFKWFDMFGVRPTFEFRGKRKYKSWCGCVISFINIFMLVTFGVFKIFYMVRESSFGASMMEGFKDLGMEMAQEVDLELEFAENPGNYEHSKWTLVKF